MPLLYIPLDISKCCEYLNIPNSKYVNKYIYDKFSEFFDYKFCPFEINKSKNYICGSKIKENEKYCKKHSQNNKVNKKQIFYCIAKSCRRNQCGRKVKLPNQMCSFHNKENKKDSQNKYLLNIDTFYFKEYKNYLNNVDYNYDDIIYKKYKFNNEIVDIVKHTFNTNSLYKIIDNVKNNIENLGNKTYYHFIYKKQIMLSEIPTLLHNPDDMKIITYNDYGYEITNQYIKDRIKRYIKNKKKNKKRKEKNKNKTPETEFKVEENTVNIEKVDYVDNDLLLRKIIKFINLKLDIDNIDEINIIINFIESIRYNKYFKFYCNFINTNIDKLLNLNNISNTEYLDDYKYKKAIIFNKNKNMNLKKILIDINFEIDVIPHKRVSWFGNKSGIIDYHNKYNVDIEKTGIKIYKKNDTMKKHKLNIDQLIIFYC